jgi:hypothetical protein
MLVLWQDRGMRDGKDQALVRQLEDDVLQLRKEAVIKHEGQKNRREDEVSSGDSFGESSEELTDAGYLRCLGSSRKP